MNKKYNFVIYAVVTIAITVAILVTGTSRLTKRSNGLK